MRWPLVAYIALVAVGMVLLTFATRPLVKHYVDRRVEQQVTQRVVKTQEADCSSAAQVGECRALLDRLLATATPEQRRAFLVQTVRTLKPSVVVKLGLRGPRGERGRRGRTGRTGARGRSGARGRTGRRGAQGPRGATGARGPAGAVGPPGPAGAPGAPGGVTSPDGGPPAGKPCPPHNPHCK